MAAYPYTVQIVWDAVNKFIEDWQSEPYRWPCERDVQAELVGRINSVYRIIGRDTVVGNYKDAVIGFEHNQKWSRVCSEHAISYTYKDGKTYLCHPDIIIWDDINNPDLPPGENVKSNWPILWVCEIKFDNKDVEGWDVEKMTYLLNQGDAKYACWLKIFFKRARSGSGIVWENPLKNQKLWLCNVRLPAFK